LAEAAARADLLFTLPDTTTFQHMDVAFPRSLNSTELARVELVLKTKLSAETNLSLSDLRLKTLETSPGTYSFTVTTVQAQPVPANMTQVEAAFLSDPLVISLSAVQTAPVSSSAIYSQPLVPANISTVKSSFYLPKTPLTAAQTNDFIAAYTAAVVASVPGTTPGQVTTVVTPDGNGWYEMKAVVSNSQVVIDYSKVNSAFMMDPRVVAATKVRAENVTESTNASMAMPMTSQLQTTVTLANKKPYNATFNSSLLISAYKAAVVSSSGLAAADLEVTMTRDPNTEEFTFKATTKGQNKTTFNAGQVQTLFLATQTVLDANDGEAPVSFNSVTDYLIARKDLIEFIRSEGAYVNSTWQNYTQHLASLNLFPSLLSIVDAVNKILSTWNIGGQSTIGQAELSWLFEAVGMSTSEATAKAAELAGASVSVGPNVTVSSGNVSQFLFAWFQNLPPPQNKSAILENATAVVVDNLPVIREAASSIRLPTEVTFAQAKVFTEAVGANWTIVSTLFVDEKGGTDRKRVVPREQLVAKIARLYLFMDADMRKGLMNLFNAKIAGGYNLDNWNLERSKPDHPNYLLVFVIILMTTGVLLMPAMHYVDMLKSVKLADRFVSTEVGETTPSFAQGGSVWSDFLYISPFTRDPASLYTSKDRLLIVMFYLSIATDAVGVRFVYSWSYASLAAMMMIAVVIQKLLEHVLKRAALGCFYLQPQTKAEKRAIKLAKQRRLQEFFGEGDEEGGDNSKVDLTVVSKPDLQIQSDGIFNTNDAGGNSCEIPDVPPGELGKETEEERRKRGAPVLPKSRPAVPDRTRSAASFSAKTPSSTSDKLFKSPLDTNAASSSIAAGGDSFEIPDVPPGELGEESEDKGGKKRSTKPGSSAKTPSSASDKQFKSSLDAKSASSSNAAGGDSFEIPDVPPGELGEESEDKGGKKRSTAPVLPASRPMSKGLDKDVPKRGAPVLPASRPSAMRGRPAPPVPRASTKSNLTEALWGASPSSAKAVSSSNPAKGDSFKIPDMPPGELGEEEEEGRPLPPPPQPPAPRAPVLPAPLPKMPVMPQRASTKLTGALWGASPPSVSPPSVPPPSVPPPSVPPPSIPLPAMSPISAIVPLPAAPSRKIAMAELKASLVPPKGPAPPPPGPVEEEPIKDDSAMLLRITPKNKPLAMKLAPAGKPPEQSVVPSTLVTPGSLAPGTLAPLPFAQDRPGSLTPSAWEAPPEDGGTKGEAHRPHDKASMSAKARAFVWGAVCATLVGILVGMAASESMAYLPFDTACLGIFGEFAFSLLVEAVFGFVVEKLQDRAKQSLENSVGGSRSSRGSRGSRPVSRSSFSVGGRSSPARSRNSETQSPAFLPIAPPPAPLVNTFT